MPVDTDEGIESDSDCEYDEYILAQTQPPHRCFSLWCRCDLSSGKPSTTELNGLAEKDDKKQTTTTDTCAAAPRKSARRN